MGFYQLAKAIPISPNTFSIYSDIMTEVVTLAQIIREILWIKN